VRETPTSQRTRLLQATASRAQHLMREPWQAGAEQPAVETQVRRWAVEPLRNSVPKSSGWHSCSAKRQHTRRLVAFAARWYYAQLQRLDSSPMMVVTQARPMRSGCIGFHCPCQAAQVAVAGPRSCRGGRHKGAHFATAKPQSRWRGLEPLHRATIGRKMVCAERR